MDSSSSLIRQRRQQRPPPIGILKPSKHSSRRFGFSRMSMTSLFFGSVQILLPLSFCYFTTSEEQRLTFEDWLIRVVSLFSLILIVLLVDATITSSSETTSQSNMIVTPPSPHCIQSRKEQKIVSFANGTKFFRLPKPKSKRQLLLLPKPSLFKKEIDDSTTPPPPCNLFSIRFQNDHSCTPSSRIGKSPAALPDWKRAHKLLQAAVIQEEEEEEEEARQESAPSTAFSTIPDTRHDIEDIVYTMSENNKGRNIFTSSSRDDDEEDCYDGDEDDDESSIPLVFEDCNFGNHTPIKATPRKPTIEKEKDEQEELSLLHLSSTPLQLVTPFRKL